MAHACSPNNPHGPPHPPAPRVLSPPQVRDVLLRKQGALVAALRAFAASVPRSILAAMGAKCAELDRALRAKTSSLEDVDAQRRLVADLPAKVAALQAEVEAAQVRGWEGRGGGVMSGGPASCVNCSPVSPCVSCAVCA